MNSWAAVGVGACLLGVGLLFMRWHVREWRQEKNDSSLDPNDLQHYHARYRRRMQTSGMLVLLGLLIPLWDWLMDLKLVIPATIVGFLVFGLVGWVILMALGDMLSTRSHSHVALSKVREKQRDLERQVADLRSRGSNGHSHNNPTGYN
jgi:hypothetical protein